MNEDEIKGLLALYEPKDSKVLQFGRQVCSARFSPCGKYLVAAGFDGLIHRWDISAAETPELPALTGHNGWVSEVVFEAGAQLLFSADTWGQLRAWTLASEPPVTTWSHEQAHDGWLRDIAVSPDGKMLATCGSDSAVRVWSAADGAKLHEFAAAGEDVARIAFHPAVGALVAADFKGIVKHWDLASGASSRQFDASVLFKYDRLQDVGGVRSMAFNADGTLLACGGTQPANGGNVQGIPTVLVFDFATGELKHKLELGKQGDVYVSDLRFHPAGFLMAVLSGNPGSGKLAYQRLADPAPFFETTKMANCHSLSLHPSGFRLAVAGTNTGSNGNGRTLDMNGEYAGNFSPIYLLDMPQPTA